VLDLIIGYTALFMFYVYHSKLIVLCARSSRIFNHTLLFNIVGRFIWCWSCSL